LNITANYVAKPVELLASGLSQKLIGPSEPIVLNGHFATMFQQIVNAAKKVQ
jgi:hypothetical protein